MPRQRVQDVGDVGMVRPDFAFDDGERLPAERDGVLEPALGLSRDGQIVETDGFVQEGRVLDPLRPPPGTAAEVRAPHLTAVVRIEVLAARLYPRRASDRTTGPAPSRGGGARAILTILGTS